MIAAVTVDDPPSPLPGGAAERISSSIPLLARRR